MRSILIGILLICSMDVFAKNAQIHRVKLELVKELKVLFEKNQAILPLEIKEKKVSFFKLINEVYAASSYQCLYGGWPSTTIKVNGKTYCHDAKSSDFYRQSYACSNSEFTCPSPLFGKDVCVPYGSRKERLGVYEACDGKAKTPELSDDFKSDDYRLLVEYTKLAKDICEKSDTDKSVVKVNCDSIMDKAKAFENLVKKEKAYVEVKKTEEKKETHKKTNIAEECAECKLKLEGTPDEESIENISDMSPRLIYESLKKNFRSSKLCNPIYNYPEEDAKGIAISSLNSVSKACSTWGKDVGTLMSNCSREVGRLKALLNVDEKTASKWDEYQNKIYSTKDDMGMYKIMLSAKRIVAESSDKKLLSDLSQKTFLENNVLIEEEGKITCPFPSYDAFEKAYSGYQKLKSKLSKPLMTIADYTMPSNQRRLFTFDMENLEPRFNTWVAHGSGNGPEDASESDGSNPPFSNKPGSNLSSDGFIIARNAAYGSMFGDNVILDGVDINNSKLRSRAIVLHGDSKTGGAYKALSFNKENFDEKMSLLKKIDIDSADDVSVRTAANAPGYFYPTIGVSWGCLGVPDADALNIKTGKYENQLQTFRRDLAGNTLIFSYSGENMRSKYF